MKLNSLIISFLALMSCCGNAQQVQSNSVITINGGLDFNQYLRDSLRFVLDTQGDPQFLIRVSFVIDTTGIMSDLNVSSVCDTCNKEVERFIHSVEMWDPIIINKPTKCRVTFYIPYWIWTDNEEPNVRHLEITQCE